MVSRAIHGYEFGDASQNTEERGERERESRKKLPKVFRVASIEFGLNCDLIV